MANINIQIRQVIGPSLEADETVLVLRVTGSSDRPMNGAWLNRWRTLMTRLGVGAIEVPDPRPAMVAAWATEALAAAAAGRPRNPVRAGRQVGDFVLVDMPPPVVTEASRLGAATVAHTETTLPPPATIDRMRAGAAKIEKIVEEWRRRRPESPITPVLEDAVRRLGVPWRWSTHYPGMSVIGEGRRLTLFDGVGPLSIQIMGSMLGKTKTTAKRYLSNFGIPTLPERIVSRTEDAGAAADAIGYPVVVKPTDGTGGRGITLNAKTRSAVEAAFAYAMANGSGVMIEPYLPIPDFRAILVSGHPYMIFQRHSPYVTGDGRSTVRKLIADHNQAVAEGRQAFPSERPAAIDPDVEQTLADAGLSLEAVPDAGRVVVLRMMPLLTYGGYATDETERLHPANAALFRRLATIVNLPLLAIDFRAEAVDRPWQDQRFAVLEFNARPNMAHFRGHPMVDALIRLAAPDAESVRLPTIFVADPEPGEGPALLRRMMADAGLAAAVASSGELQLGGLPVRNAATPGEAHALMVQDPTLAVGVHWTPVEPAVQSGLGIATIDIAYLPERAATPLEEAVIGLIRQRSRQVRPLPAGDAAARADAILSDVRALSG